MADMTASSPNASSLEKPISYAVKTQKGFILAAEAVLGLVVLICYAASQYGTWIGVPISGTIHSAVFFGVFMMELDKQFKWVHWVWTDFFRAIVFCGLYLITSIIMLSYQSHHGDTARLTGCVLSLVVGVLHAYDTYTIVQQLRSSSPSQQDTASLV